MRKLLVFCIDTMKQEQEREREQEQEQMNERYHLKFKIIYHLCSFLYFFLFINLKHYQFNEWTNNQFNLIR